MRIKKYQAPTVHEALKLIKADLGPDAIILSTQTIKKNGPFGFLDKPVVEITAAIDAETPVIRKEESQGDRSNPGFQRFELSPANPWTSQENPGGKEIGLKEELVEIKQMISSLLSIEKSEVPLPLSPEASSYYLGLNKAGVDPMISLKLIEKLERTYPSREGLDLLKWQKGLYKSISGLIEVTGSFLSMAGQANAHVFLGPTGVGKTTTLVKLAAQFTMVQKKRVAIINIDNYRIGAEEQIKIYSQIIGTPMQSVSDAPSFRKALKSFADYDLVLIDTAGRSQKDADQLRAMSDFIQKDLPIYCHLILSATTKERDLKEIINKFLCFDLKSLAFTKIDESNSFGEILNQSLRVKKPLSYVAVGQKVPEDLELATPEKITQLILRDIGILGVNSIQRGNG